MDAHHTPAERERLQKTVDIPADLVARIEAYVKQEDLGGAAMTVVLRRILVRGLDAAGVPR